MLREVRGLVDKGFREIVLTGICLGAWGKDFDSTMVAEGVGLTGLALVDILIALRKVEGDFRVRLSSIEPKYIIDDLIELMSKDERICRHLHIPLQSGDDEILARMNRPYTALDYKMLIERIRGKIEDIAITTDVLIGFPGESESNFKNTLAFLKEIGPARTHIFTFSKREGTAAYEMRDEVGKDIARMRYYRLNAASLAASYIYRRKFLNEKLDVLVETKRTRRAGLLTGYSGNYIKVLFEGPDELMGKTVPVRIEGLTLLHTVGGYDG